MGKKNAFSKAVSSATKSVSKAVSKATTEVKNYFDPNNNSSKSPPPPPPIPNTSCQYQMSNTEMKCYQARYPDLLGITSAQLQSQWTGTGCNQKRNNQCPSPQITSGTYNFKGCYNDNNSSKSIPNFRQKVSNIDQCQNIATNKQQNVFGLHNNGECWTGSSIEQAYQYGQNYDGSMCGNLGGTATNMVYVVSRPYPPPIPPIPVLSTINFATTEPFSNMDTSHYFYSYKNIYLFILISILIYIFVKLFL